jgi:3-oxoisoapionate kinase
VNDRIGTGLGQLLDGLLRRTGVRRAVIAGGDTSGHAAQHLGIDALTALAPLAPGAPLCTAHSPDGALRGLQLVLKGGQGGGEDVFTLARAGGRHA